MNCKYYAPQFFCVAFFVNRKGQQRQGLTPEILHTFISKIEIHEKTRTKLWAR
ncbi:MAG: DUF4368 domain-containing protein [Ruminococcus sp.]|nr:DUF4368 domain-containing protein [Ruminococcus sp.]